MILRPYRAAAPPITSFHDVPTTLGEERLRGISAISKLCVLCSAASSLGNAHHTARAVRGLQMGSSHGSTGYGAIGLLLQFMRAGGIDPPQARGFSI